ncbi:histidine phosphatase family protein [Xylocopilactobacillus apicola]|uniref:Phosphoglycerate mutase n=1 Tax=Xylocopilactobacillus apicola TaxID=2932184 RepID=A0AAU9CZZ5_9LACO|nr:histidine phosphatase family protein [Xylocopilactobacillus apicola]BDR58011.1 phosphoglycerate mutase [Xylocopilactobacillus apicola]
MKTLYVVRHGETMFNVQHRIQGWSDSPLTEKGIEQAKQVGKYFEDIPLDHAYSSTSERCCDTMELILQERLPYQRLKALKEMNFGILEGETERINPKGPKAYQTFFLPYGGESSNTVGKRMLECLTDLMSQPDNQNVLVVSHAGSSFNFLRMIQDPTEELNKGFSNGSIFVYQFEDQQFKLGKVIRLF